MILLLPVTKEEVKNAVFQMHPEKASGPDGMTPAFYQKYWSIVGDDIVKLVAGFFQDGRIDSELNKNTPSANSEEKESELTW